MSVAESFDLAVLEGFAQTAVASTDLWYSRTTPAPAGRIPIVLDITPESPDDVVTLRDYTVTDSPNLSDSTVGVQVDIRSKDRARIRSIMQALFDTFHGREAGMLGDVRLVMAVRSSGTWLGQDSNDRLQRTENYYLTVHRPSPNRT